MSEEEAPKEVERDPDDILKEWFKARVVSSLKCKPETADALVNNEASRVAVEAFLNNETSQRLLVYSDPDLVAVRVTPTRLPQATRSRSASRSSLPTSSGAVGSDSRRNLAFSDRETLVLGVTLVFRRARPRVSDAITTPSARRRRPIETSTRRPRTRPRGSARRRCVS